MSRFGHSFQGLFGAFCRKACCIQVVGPTGSVDSALVQLLLV